MVQIVINPTAHCDFLFSSGGPSRKKLYFHARLCATHFGKMDFCSSLLEEIEQFAEGQATSFESTFQIYMTFTVHHIPLSTGHIFALRISAQDATHNHTSAWTSMACGAESLETAKHFFDTNVSAFAVSGRFSGMFQIPEFNRLDG